MDQQTTKSNNLFSYLKEETGLFERRLIVIYSLAGIFHFLIIATIIVTINSTSEQDLQFLIFMCFSLLAYVRVNKISRDKSHNVIEEMVSRIRQELTDKIRKISVLSFDKLGHTQLSNILTQELVYISEAAKQIAGIFTSSAVLIVSILYLAYLSAPAVLVSAFVIVFGVYIYRVYRDEIEKEMIAANHKENDYFQKLRHLLDGFKEIKISDVKNNDLFYNHIAPIIKETEELKKVTNARMNNAVIFAQTFCYILMGVMIFIFPQLFEVEEADLIQIVTLILFLTTGPLQEVVGAFPAIERANISIQLLSEVENFFKQAESEIIAEPGEDDEVELFETLECRDLLFHYRENGGDKAFEIGPVNFNVNRGEIIFIKGGNGAGKSTFFHVLSGLYRHTGGELLWNGRPVHQQNVNRYRANFAVIYQDMHLFDRVYGVKEIDFDRVSSLLQTFKIENKTGIEADGRISSLKLSVGQKKRLALIAAELENRQIHVYDEWAADQDPLSRQYFYETYIQDLKQRGKTVIAITHDDKYYNHADRLFRMEYGKLTEEKIRRPRRKK